MEPARANWNDDRLDRLADQVDGLRRHMDERFQHMDDRFQHIDDRFLKQETVINERFDRLQMSLVVALAGVLTAVVVPSVF